MPAIDTVRDVLAASAAELGAPGLDLDQDGLCAVDGGDGPAVHVHADAVNERCALLAVVGQMPRENRSEALRALLAANLEWSDTLGATLALEPERDAVLLQKAMPLTDLTPASFQAAFTAFRDLSALWAERLDPANMAGEADPQGHPNPAQPA